MLFDVAFGLRQVLTLPPTRGAFRAYVWVRDKVR
jgi:hypothetical protein